VGVDCETVVRVKFVGESPDYGILEGDFRERDLGSGCA
jgi:hypothetical protein